jgi:DNA (cytosine-5)-methyltransferase 1
MNRKPVLSLFSGIGLLDSGFERNGFCVVRGPEKITGGDIRDFHSVPGVFGGIVGGSPCQDFSRARRTPPTGEGLELLNEFCRVVRESQSDWFLLENVPGVPDVCIDGFHIQRFELSPVQLGFSQNRLRHFQFGSKTGLILTINRRTYSGEIQPCITASEGSRPNRRTWSEFCQLQGLPPSFDLPEFNQIARYRAVGNGVHTGVSMEVARAIREAIDSPSPKTIFNTRVCACGCGRIVTGKQKSATATCRKRLETKRKRVTDQASRYLGGSQM